MIELLAVLVILVLLLATFVPYGMSLRESSNRTRCAANLATINRALREYAAGNGYFYPRVRYSPAMGNQWVAFTGPDDGNPFAESSAVSPNDVTASLWLLVREGFAQPEWFLCPSEGGSVDRIVDAAGEQTVVKRRSNFRSPDNLGYAYATPFSAVGDYRLNDTLPARFPLLADRGPSAEALDRAALGGLRFDSHPKSFRPINSRNHAGAGQNVLYADGTVRFEWSPYCGVRKALPSETAKPVDRNDGDNLYTALSVVPLVPPDEPPVNKPGVTGARIGPSYKYDAVLVPAVDYGADASKPIVMSPTTEPSSTPATDTVQPPASEPSTQP